MSKQEEVIKFVSEFVGVPAETISLDTVLSSDFDWDGMHPDETLPFMFEYFLKEFRVRVISQEFSTFTKGRKIPWILKPVYYVLFIEKFREQIDIDDATVGDMVRAAESGIWPE